VQFVQRHVLGPLLLPSLTASGLGPVLGAWLVPPVLPNATMEAAPAWTACLQACGTQLSRVHVRVRAFVMMSHQDTTV